MDTIELVASSMEDAQEQAAAKLGVPAADVKVTLIEEVKGLFGKPSKIKFKAEAKAARAAKPKAEKAAKPAKAEAVVEPAAEPEPELQPEEKKPARPARAAKPRAEKAEKPAKAESTGEGEEAERPAVVASEEDGQKVVDILNSLFEKAGIRADATLSSLNGRYLNIGIDGRDVGFLVGRRGEVLNALQYLSNVIVSRRMQSGVRVTLDGNNYREAREQALTTMAIEIATAVKERGEEAVLDALPAFERRIVHQALLDFEGITTYSEGEEPNRYVVIGPA